MTHYALGVDIGGSHVCSAIVDITNGTIIGSPIKTDIDHTRPAEDLFTAWAQNLSESLAAAPERVRSIGMAFPGPFDYALGISHMEHKFPALCGLNIGEELRRRMEGGEDLEFRFVNDASSFALGESYFGAAREAERVIALPIGTGLGAGFIADHKLIESGPEVPPGGEVWNLPYRDGIADEYFSTRWIVGRYKELTGTEVPGAKEVAERFESEAEARQVFEEFGTGIATFMAPLLRQFGCKDLLFGGNISRSLPLFLPSMQTQFEKEGLNITASSSILFDHATMMGAAALFC